MNNLKKYSKPLMIVEQFVPNNYCKICEPKQEVSYTLTDPYESYQHFVMDYNKNGICDESDLDHIQTTDNGTTQPEYLTVHVKPDVCWPSTVSNPKHTYQVLTDTPLWYYTNDHNHSGHVYAYQTIIINYNHS